MSDTSKNPAQGRTGDGWNQIQKHEDAERVKTLSSELENYLNSATEEVGDMDKLDGILSELERVSPLPDGDAFDAERGLERFHERLAAREAAEGKSPAEKDIISSSLRRSKKRTISRVLLIAAVLTLILATTAQAFRVVDIFDLFARWGSEVFGFQKEKTEYAEIMKRPLAIGEKREYASVQEMMDDFGITVPLFPTWVPERFGEPIVYATNLDKKICFFVDYSKNVNHLHIRLFEIIQNFQYTEKDAADSESERINGIYFYFMSDDLSDRSDRLEKVAWQNGQMECKLYGTVTRDEMKQIVYSIYER